MNCPKFWTEDPSILVREAYDFFPFHEGAKRCTTTALNSFTRFGIYLGLVLTIVNVSFVYLTIGVAIAIVSVAAYYGMKSRDIIREGFVSTVTTASHVTPTPIASGTVFSMPGVNPIPEPAGLVKGIEAAGKPVADVIGQTNRTEPTAANPFMNVLVHEIGEDPTKPPAASGETLKRQFSDEFQQRLYGDPTDVFQHSQNQRVWSIQPSTSIPNDRESYQNWLYRVPGRTCKEGNSQVCKTATDGSVLPWISQA